MTDAPLTLLLGDLDVSPASTAALGLARWLADRGTPPAVVSTWGGPRRAAFEGVADVHVVNDDVGWDSGRVLASLDQPRAAGSARPPRRRVDGPTRAAVRALATVGLHRVAEATRSTALRHRLRAEGPVLAVGAASARLAHYLPEGRPVTVVLPAGEDPPEALAEADDRRALGRRARRVVVGEEAHRDRADALAPGLPVEVVPDLLVVDTGPGRDVVRARLGIAGDAPLVASVGAFDWWDQPDGFVTVAWELRRRRPDLGLVWAAGDATDRMLWPLRHDLAHAGLDGVAITGTDPPPLAVLAAADVILLARRGEVPRWVLAEARTVGVPVVRWAVDPDEGPGRRAGEIVVAHLDEPGLAAAVLATLDDPQVADEVADAARAVRHRHGPEQVAPALLRAVGL